MNTLINLALRALGFGSAVDAIDGETSKAYIGGLGMILGGAATLLGGVANIVNEVLPLHGFGDYITFAQNITHDPNAAVVLAGWLAIHKGIEAIGQRHATAKLANAVEAKAQPVAGQQQAQ